MSAIDTVYSIYQQKHPVKRVYIYNTRGWKVYESFTHPLSITISISK